MKEISLSYNQAIVYESLKRTQDKHKIAEMTGIHFTNVGNNLVVLHKKGMVKRFGKGKYRAIKKEYVRKEKQGEGKKIEQTDKLIDSLLNMDVDPAVKKYIVSEDRKQTKRSLIARKVKLNKTLVNHIIAEGRG